MENIVDKIIEKYNKNYNPDELEIYLYNLNCMLCDTKNDIDDFFNDWLMNIDNIDYIKTMNILTQKYLFLENEKNNNSNILIIDTPNNDDIFTLFKFDENGKIINHLEIQSNIDVMKWENKNDISIISDCFQFFDLIDFNNELKNIRKNWIYGIKINITYDYLTNLIINWIERG